LRILFDALDEFPSDVPCFVDCSLITELQVS
jgi:hypothetical protein